MTSTTLPVRAALLATLLALALPAGAAERREKIAVMKVDAPALNRDEVSSLRDRLEVGVTRAVGTRLQVITKDSAAASVGGAEKLLACMEGASCDAEIGGALGVDYFVSASVRKTALGLELGVTLLRIGRDVSLLRKDLHSFSTMRDLLDGTAAHAEVVTRAALGGMLGAPGARAAAGTFGEEGKGLTATDADEVVVAFETVPDGAVVLVDGQVLCQASPCRKRVAAGAHEATFQKERYAAAVQPFTAKAGAAVKAVLAPRFGWLTVETAPPGVAIAIDGSDAGRSPVAAREVDEGTVEVAVSDPCYLRGGERVSVNAGERRTVKVAARPRIAGLKVNAEDEKGNAVEADVTVDGAAAGRAGGTLQVPVCASKVTVALGKEIFEAELKLEEGKVAVVTARPGASAPSGGMARLPGGTYTMGETSRAVTVQPFLLDVTAVTVAAYEACVHAGKCSEPDADGSCNWGKADRASHPVNCVDWSQAAAFCAWAGKRLPSEEEREWAARGAERGTRYPWGNDRPADQLCWNGGNVQRSARSLGTCAVGSYPAGDSPHHLKDLAGNVWEWTSSAHESSDRVVRGGSWYDATSRRCAASSRSWYEPSDFGAYIGFRCARTP